MKHACLFRSIFVAAFLLTTICAKAQWVSIPDTNFAKAISPYLAFPCVVKYSANDYRLDTTCAELFTEKSHLYINGSGIKNLDGIQYFKDIKQFGVNNNLIDSFPKLSDSLISLRCQNNLIKSLISVPKQLRELFIAGNLLDSADFSDFHALQTLYAENNSMSFIKAFPPNAVFITLYNNLLKSIPPFTAAIRDIQLDYNLLDSLPALPLNLRGIGCGFNRFKKTPVFHENVTYISFDHNELTEIPNLPNYLSDLIINGNLDLQCLPQLGAVERFNFDSTSILCLPNYPTQNIYSFPSLDSIPVCLAANPNGCQNIYRISGNVFSDNIPDCSIDISEQGVKAKVFLYNDGILKKQIFSDESGAYSFYTELDSFQIFIDTTDLPYQVACPSSFFHTSILTSQDSIDTDKDFGLRCKQGFDLGVHSAVRDSGILFPAQKAGIKITAGDLSRLYGLNCAGGISGTVSITYSGTATFAGVRPNALTPMVSGKTLTYDIADFGAINMQTAFGLRFLVDSFAQIGQQLCLDITVMPTAGDNNVSNNTATYCFPIVNSYDPNMKEVSPVNNIAPDEDWLTYTIHFQNMGTAPAIHIYVMDTLDSNLDESSIQILGNSHRMLTEIKGNIARFNFPNINLVNSITDKELSKGWLQYKIKKKAALPLGTQIKNTASIYFDFNAPVVTNTVMNTVAQPSAVAPLSFGEGLGVRLFPNPTNDVVYIDFGKEIVDAEVALYNMQGSLLNVTDFKNLQGLAAISLSALPAGVYVLEVAVAEGQGVRLERKRVVKM